MARGKGSQKRPKHKSALTPTVKKKPTHVAPVGGYDTETPAWLLADVDLEGPWGWTDIDKETLLETIVAKLAKLESMKWSEILRDSKKQNHAVDVSALIPKAQRRLQDLQLDDFDRLISLRLGGRERIWGIRDPHDGRVLRLLWWDPNHEVCPSQKKHT